MSSEDVVVYQVAKLLVTLGLQWRLEHVCSSIGMMS